LTWTYRIFLPPDILLLEADRASQEARIAENSDLAFHVEIPQEERDIPEILVAAPDRYLFLPAVVLEGGKARGEVFCDAALLYERPYEFSTESFLAHLP